MMKLDEGRFAQSDFQLDNLNGPKATNDFRSAVTIEQPLFDPGIGYGLDAARTEDDAAGFSLARRREDVAFGVYGAYLEVQRAKARLAAADKAVEAAREHGRLAAARSGAGTGLRSDELRARAHLADMEQQRLTAGNDVTLARMRLALATGAPSGEGLDIREPVAAPGETAEGDLVMVALKNRQDLHELEKQVERAGIGVKQAGSAWFPTASATASYQMNSRDVPFGRDNDAWMAGARLSWEMFDGFRRSGESRKAQAVKSAADERLEQYRKEIALEVTACRLRRAEAAQRLEFARSAIADSEEGARIVATRYENALATMVDLLDAQTALDRSRAAVADCEADYALAAGRLHHAAGIFLKEVMK
jgi:outer membrane protein TolC